MKNALNPNCMMIQPPNKGNSAGRMFPAPAIPVYNALLLVPEISSKTPFMVML